MQPSSIKYNKQYFNNLFVKKKQVDKMIEAKLKSINSMADMRSADKDKPDLKIKEGWTESVETLQSLIRNRFLRLKLKDDPIEAVDPVSEIEIDIIKRHLRELFPSLDVDKLQNIYTQKCAPYQLWLEKHCKQSHYVFQIRKCGDAMCCIPPKVESISWLPDPVLDISGEHYVSFKDLVGKDTTEKDRQSLKE